MNKGRQNHACAMLGHYVVILGGESSIRNSLEIFDGAKWNYRITKVGATGQQLISTGNHAYLFAGYDENEERSGNIWRIDKQLNFTVMGKLEKYREYYVALRTEYGYLKNCEGRSLKLFGVLSNKCKLKSIKVLMFTVRCSLVKFDLFFSNRQTMW